MKHFLTLALFACSLVGYTQVSALFNPDYNGDSQIGVDDILGVLSHYDTAWDGNPNLGSVIYQGHSYKTVTINGREWMAENLRATAFQNGDAISDVSGNSEWNNQTSPALCGFAYPYLDEFFGKLYNGYAALDSRNVCPTSWHVPTSEEWIELALLLGDQPSSNFTGGNKWKSQIGWSESANGSNVSGFSALPSSYRHFSGSLVENYNHTGWWTSTQVNETSTEMIWLFESDQVSHVGYLNNAGYPIRCIKDSE